MVANNPGVEGKDVIVRIENSGATAFLEVEHQNDATYNTGITGNKKRAKNGTLPYQTREGASISFSYQKTRPMSAGQLRLVEVAGTGELVKVEYDDPNTGGQKRAGTAQVTLGSESAATDGLTTVEVTINFEGDPVETVNA
jgi:hypothetical protein